MWMLRVRLNFRVVAEERALTACIANRPSVRYPNHGKGSLMRTEQWWLKGRDRMRDLISFSHGDAGTHLFTIARSSWDSRKTGEAISVLMRPG